MGYHKATDILPTRILKELQEYIDGEFIYIPRKETNRKSWGSETDTRLIVSERNKKIYQEYLAGTTYSQLAQKYYLVEKSIQRIIRQEKDINI